LGFEVQGSGFRVQGSGVQGLGLTAGLHRPHCSYYPGGHDKHLLSLSYHPRLHLTAHRRGA